MRAVLSLSLSLESLSLFLSLSSFLSSDTRGWPVDLSRSVSSLFSLLSPPPLSLSVSSPLSSLIATHLKTGV